MGNPEQMQQAMSQMMNNPMMQNVLNDPEMLRNMFSSNPAIQQVHTYCCFLASYSALLDSCCRPVSRPNLSKDSPAVVDTACS